ncbi:ATP-binding protein [Streptomyces sp. NPDC056485]|uniref:ATP-binding protein n=1 Tax=Streptomyces sp. NPDC056485 TaxID=3345834 RepID=UPI00369D96A9
MEDQTMECRFVRSPRSVRLARALFAVQAREWKLPDDLAETALLLLSELMTNACRHARVPAGREVWMRAAWEAGRLRVEVLDASRELPVPREAAPGDEAGRGLAIVAALAADWGAHPRGCGIGKVVWFELRTGAQRPRRVGSSMSSAQP